MDCQIFAVQRYKNHVNATAFYEYDNMLKIFKNLAAENPVAVRKSRPAFRCNLFNSHSVVKKDFHCSRG